MRGFFLRLFGKKNIKAKRSLEPSLLLGCIKGKKDVRDYRYTTSVQTFPEDHIISQLPPVRNQERIGSCCSHAVIGAYETLMLNKAPRRFLEGSELYHYWNARHLIANSGDADSGMTIRDGCKTIDKYHMATEYAWPYLTAKFNTKPPWWVYATSGAYKIKEYQRLTNLAQIKASLLEGVPVVVGIQAMRSIFTLQGENSLYVPKGESVGGHAVLIIGYDDQDGVFLFRNSWGFFWGNEGNFEMRYEDFQKFSFDWFRILIQ